MNNNISWRFLAPPGAALAYVARACGIHLSSEVKQRALIEQLVYIQCITIQQ
jgi:hypothetical protein